MASCSAILVDKTIGMGDDVERPALDFVVDAPQIFADNAQEDQLNAAQKEHADQGRRLAQEKEVAGKTQDNR